MILRGDQEIELLEARELSGRRDEVVLEHRALAGDRLLGVGRLVRGQHFG